MGIETQVCPSQLDSCRWCDKGEKFFALTAHSSPIARSIELGDRLTHFQHSGDRSPCRLANVFGQVNFWGAIFHTQI
jgi:hypothetical protein